ncbi:class I SAM-dependent methyltransferase [Methanosalsum zhilinae]|nr:nicotianamine synthase family protein [Methanosalsum zhilinae]
MYYKRLVAKEIAIATISQNDHILCIGGGPFPCTAIEIAEQTGAQVTVVDNDPEAVEISRKVVSRLHLNNRIQVIQADGENVSAHRYSLVHIALQVYPKEKVLANICHRITPHTRILMRRTKIIFSHILYGIETDFCSSNADCLGQNLKCINCTMKNTVLLVKNEMGVKDEKCNIVSDWPISSDRNALDC